LLIHDIDARLAGYRLLAEAAGLETLPVQGPTNETG
jgi:hypothetical protein